MGKTAGNNRNSNISVKNDKKSDRKKYINLKLNNKVKLQLWEQRRQKNFKRRYNKEFKKHKITPNEEPTEIKKSGINPNEELTERVVDTQVNNDRVGAFKAAQLEIKRRKEEKKRLVQEKIQKKKEIDQAIGEYKKKKAEKFKKLSKKTKRGQPVMRDRIQLLYEEIQQKISNENT